MSNKTYKAREVSDYFLYLSLVDTNKMCIIKLVKLTILAYGFCLAVYNKRLFLDKICAFKHGPVIFNVLRGYDLEEINGIHVPLQPARRLKYSANNFKECDKKLLNQVYESYKRFTGLELSSILHKDGSPYQKTVEQAEESNVSLDIEDNIIVSDLDLCIYYMSLIVEAKKGKS